MAFSKLNSIWMDSKSDATEVVTVPLFAFMGLTLDKWDSTLMEQHW